MIDKYSGIYRGPPRGQTTPFSDIVYYDPVFSEWKEWFAWYPVRIIDQHCVESGLKVQRWVWFQKILRRKVVDAKGNIRRRKLQSATVNYEYTTLLFILKLSSKEEVF